MLGPLDARPKERAAPAPRAARKRKEPTGPAVRPEELQELGQGQGQEKKETDRNLELMYGVIKEFGDQLVRGEGGAGARWGGGPHWGGAGARWGALDVGWGTCVTGGFYPAAQARAGPLTQARDMQLAFLLVDGHEPYLYWFKAVRA